MWIYLNNKFVTDKEAVVSVFDHGFLYGDGVYETIRSYGEKIFMRDQHLARLLRSAEAIGLTIPKHDWPALLHESMKRNEGGNDQIDAYIRITISRGIGDIGLDPALCPNLQSSAIRVARQAQQFRGLRLASEHDKRVGGFLGEFV